MKKMLTLVLAMLLIISCLTACGASNAAATDLSYIQGKGKLVVGITDYAPMDYKDENGNWTGFDAEFAQLVCKELGVDTPPKLR